jgi:hypothetical protein
VDLELLNPMGVRLLSETFWPASPVHIAQAIILDVWASATSANLALSFSRAKSDLPLGADLLTTMMRFGAEAIFDALAKVASERVQSC